MNKHLLYILTLTQLFLSINANANLPSGEWNSSNASMAKKIQSQPIHFTENKGQINDMAGKPVPFVLFSAGTQGMNLYITESGLTYVFNKKEDKLNNLLPVNQTTWNRIDMALAGASIKKENIIKEGMSANFSQYFLPHCPNGISDVHNFEKVTIKEIYPGIDWVFYNSNEKGFKYDFIVHPGADPKQIEMVYSSLLPLSLDKTGNIDLKTEIGKITENAPYSYIQENKKEVGTKFKIINQKLIKVQSDEHYETTIGFQLFTSAIQKSTLVIDPQLFWATFYGGENSEVPADITTDLTGNVFVTGNTISPNFPIKNAGINTYQGAYGGQADAFIMKFSNSGVLLWSTLYGGIYSDGGHSLTTDKNGNLFVCGLTQSINFPVQDAGTFFQKDKAGAVTSANVDAFILKFDNAGKRRWATYYGGTGDEIPYSILFDGNNNIFLTGNTTSSTDFPLKNSGTFFQNVYAGGLYDAFILKFDTSGNRHWSTFYGGVKDEQGTDIAIDNSKNLYITGYTTSTNFPLQDVASSFQGTLGGAKDAFILKFDKLGNRLWSTYYGGKNNDLGTSIGLDQGGNVFVSGGTSSNDFPIKDAGTFFQPEYGGGGDAFILKFDSAGNRLWASYYGSSANDFLTPSFLAVDKCGSFYFTLSTSSNNITTKAPCDGGYYDSTYNGGISDVLITRFSNKGALIWATFFSGEGFDFLAPTTLDNNGNLFITGRWAPSLTIVPPVSYPLKNPGNGAYYVDLNQGSDDGFIVKFKKNSLISTITSSISCSCLGTATANTIGGCGPYTYLWSDGQTTQTAIGLCDGIYSVLVTDTFGCGTSNASIVITSLPTPTSSFSTTGPVCVGENSNITYTGNPTTATAIYDWNFDGGVIVSGSGQGPYAVKWDIAGTKNITLKVTGDNCTSTITTNTVIVKALDNAIFSYTSGTFCNSSSNPTPTISGLMGGVFTAIPATLVINSSTGEINLSQSPLGTYRIKYTTNGTCINSEIFDITITNAPSATFSYTGPYCKAATSNPLPTFPNGSSAGTFSAMPAGLVFVNNNTGKIDLSTSDAGEYTITNTIAASGSCNADVKTNTVTIYAEPISTFTLPIETCVGIDIEINFTGNPISGANYVWDFDGGKAIGTNQGPYTVKWDSAGIKNVSLSVTANGCTSILTSHSVNVFPLPIAMYDYTKNYLEVAFKGDTSNGVNQWLWDFGDQSAKSSEQNPIHTYLQKDSFNVTLIVWNKCGSDTIIFNIKVDEKTGVSNNNNSISKEISVYPNPFTDQINIDFWLSTASNVSFDMYDVLGRKMYTYNLGNLNKGEQKIKLNTEILPSEGHIFYLQININQDSYRKQIIKFASRLKID